MKGLSLNSTRSLNRLDYTGKESRKKGLVNGKNGWKGEESICIIHSIVKLKVIKNKFMSFNSF